MVACKRKNPGDKLRASVRNESAIYYCIDKVEPNYGLFLRAAPNIFYGEIPPGMFTLGGAPDSSNRVRALDDRPLVLVGGTTQCSAARAATYSSACKERSVFPLTVMTPRGPGILSLR